MIRAACGVEILIPVAFGVLWAKRKAELDGLIIQHLSEALEELHGAFQFFPGGSAILH